MLFNSNNCKTIPEDDEVEVAIFGAGFGEAIAIHISGGRWILVDSCKFASGDKSATLKYLEDLEVSPKNVVAIVASHWDDDHVAGLADLLITCENADFVISNAFVHTDFLRYADTFALPLTVKARAGVREMLRSLIHCREADRVRKYAGPARRLYHESSSGSAVEVWTLSPSDSEYSNFLAWIVSQIPTTPSTRRLAIARKRNDLSAVLLLRVGDDVMLFGADLEEEGKEDTGWSAIIADPGRPRLKAAFFKVAHHGSKNGDHDGIRVVSG